LNLFHLFSDFAILQTSFFLAGARKNTPCGVFAAFQSILTFVSTIFFCMLNSTAIIAQMPMAK